MYSIVPPGNTFWYSSDVPKYGEGLSREARVRKAYEILKQAGYTWEVPPVFRTLQDLGGVPGDEMWKTFNMGVGMVVAVPQENAAALLQEIEAAGEVVYAIGAVAEGSGVTFEPGFQPVP